jgi:ABC-2 type transport system ATP-binding protein
MIEARGLTKRYGSTVAVNGLSFDVRPGTVTGFLGPNGSGKSTTMRMIIGLDHLTALAASNGIPASRVDTVLAHTGLSSVAGRRPGKFSLGMAQRLGIATALLGDPEVLLLDEPVNGLDPEGIRWIRNLLKSLAAQGRTVLVSSHLISEMALMADRLIVIGRGRLLADTTVAELSARADSLEDAFFNLTAGQAEYRAEDYPAQEVSKS